MCLYVSVNLDQQSVTVHVACPLTDGFLTLSILLYSILIADQDPVGQLISDFTIV